MEKRPISYKNGLCICNYWQRVIFEIEPKFYDFETPNCTPSVSTKKPTVPRNRGWMEQRRAPAPAVPEAFVIAVEALVLSGIVLAGMMMQGLGEPVKFMVNGAVILLLSMYCAYVVVLCYRRGVRVYSDGAVGVGGSLLGYISGVAYRRHILKLKLNDSPDDLTCLVLAAASFVLLLIAAALRRAGR